MVFFLLKVLALIALGMFVACLYVYREEVQGYMIGRLYRNQFQRMSELLEKLTHVVLLRVDVNSIHALVTGEPIRMLARRKWLFLDLERRGNRVTAVRYIFQTDDDPDLNELRLERVPGDFRKMGYVGNALRSMTGKKPKEIVLATIPLLMSRFVNSDTHNERMRRYNYSDCSDNHDVDAVYDNVRKRLVLLQRRRR